MAAPEQDDGARLAGLLHELGLDESLLATANWTVLAMAGAIDAEMSAVYAQLNRELLALASLRPFEMVHITGEARVLVDPAHRNVIRSNYLGGNPTILACRDRPEPIEDAATFLAAQQNHWTLLTWVDFLDIVALFATGAATLKVLPHDAPVHYSIFGHDRILIQEPQTDSSERKRVWYIESEGLVRLLTLTTNRILAHARTVPSTGFSALLQWLYTENIFPLVGATVISELVWAKLRAPDIDRLREVGILDYDGSEARIRFLPDLTYLRIGDHGKQS